MTDQKPLGEEIDFEPDVDPTDPAPKPGADLGGLSLIVDDVHVTYRVYGGRRAAASGDELSVVRRLLNRTNRHIGAVTEVKAIRGVSFVARHGEAIGIVGRNGSGKSTLLRAVAGLLPLSGGTVYISGEASLLGVNAALMKDLTGERNIMIGGLALGLTATEVRERYDEIVEFSGIGDAVNLPMKAYSSGMGARLRFAISSAARPDVLMVDEALATGDAEFRARSKQRIDEIREQAGTIFLVSHSLAAVRSMCSRVLWIDKGKLRMDGPVDEVCDAYQEFTRPRRPAR
ncbi:MAG: ATP-binding cassette domain-containing protein [Propionibacteriales bacterium]|nr:ATP-binding cassette domain-containing protein [Propionibacteriales bacterium]